MSSDTGEVRDSDQGLLLHGFDQQASLTPYRLGMLQGFGFNSPELEEVQMPGSDVVVAGERALCRAVSTHPGAARCRPLWQQLCIVSVTAAGMPQA